MSDRKTIEDIQEFNLNGLKSCQWNKDSRFCVLQCRKDIYLMNKVFKKVARIPETNRILHGFWTKDNFFVYSTYNHLKYLLPNGDRGILRSLPDVQFPVGMIDNTVFTIGIDNLLSKQLVSKSECLFKSSLMQNDIQGVKSFIKNNKLVGQSLISYLQKKNYPAVALSLTTDLKSKFELALKSGNLQAAYESATHIKDPACFDKLAQEALLHGCSPVL